MTEGAPPGWYTDPSFGARLRWWDGARWTEHTAAAPVAAASPAQQPVAGDVTNWAVVAHLSALVGLVIGFSFLGPMVVYLVKRDGHPYVREHAAEALNFNISVAIYALVLGLVTLVLLLVLVGILLIPLLIAGAVAWLVLVVVAAVNASKGRSYRYPLTIRFVT